jgi:hypothetical protein
VVCHTRFDGSGTKSPEVEEAYVLIGAGKSGCYRGTSSEHK